MGCWNEYCPLCGLVLGHFLNVDVDSCDYDAYPELLTLYKNNPTKFENVLENININFEWLNNITFLDINNNNHYNCNCNNECDNFYNKDETIQYKHCNFLNEELNFDEEEFIIGFGVHTKCIEYIKNKYLFEFKYSDFNIGDIKYDCMSDSKKIFKDIDYGNIEHCWSQWFNTDTLLKYHYEDIDKIVNGPEQDNFLGNMIDKVLLSRCPDKLL